MKRRQHDSDPVLKDTRETIGKLKSLLENLTTNIDALEAELLREGTDGDATGTDPVH